MKDHAVTTEDLNTIAATVARLETIDTDLQRRIAGLSDRAIRPLELIEDALSLIPEGFEWGAGSGEEPGFWAWVAPQAHAEEIVTASRLTFAITAAALWAISNAREQVA
ncbi:hypothetical protein [Pseudooceanicola nanhaiensis]|uniref:hypothetical protein n=1 Tax=Pseudooceanicola nanhaiensis TaxID=375761 RepID=UPI0040593BA3